MTKEEYQIYRQQYYVEHKKEENANRLRLKKEQRAFLKQNDPIAYQESLAKNKENIRLYRNTQRGKETAFISSHRFAAKKRNLIDDITDAQLLQLGSANCHYCGVEPGETKWQLNGVDRMDNTKGYTLDNCVSCCFMCNGSKRDYTLDKWKQWIKRLYSNYISLPTETK